MDPLTWKTFGVLMAGALIGAVAILPYALGLAPPPARPDLPPLAFLLAVSVVQTLVLAGACAALGLWLGPKVGLGAPLLRAWLAGDRAVPGLLGRWLPLAVGLGVAASVLILLLDKLLFAPNLPPLQTTAPAQGSLIWQGLLASLYGGIDEEILLRLGLMTFLVWLLTRLGRGHRTKAGHMWLANVLAAVLFGLGHLPATAAVLPLTQLVILRAVVLNGLAGIAFGWLYWRQGILLAMVSHLCADLVLHVLIPTLSLQS